MIVQPSTSQYCPDSPVQSTTVQFSPVQLSTAHSQPSTYKHSPSSSLTLSHPYPHLHFQKPHSTVYFVFYCFLDNRVIKCFLIGEFTTITSISRHHYKVNLRFTFSLPKNDNIFVLLLLFFVSFFFNFQNIYSAFFHFTTPNQKCLEQ